MYGYASELLPYIQGLLSSNADAPQGDAPMQLPGAAKSATPDMRGLAGVGANLMAASRKGQTPQQRQAAMSSAPLPPRRPEGLLGAVAPDAPQASATDDDKMRAFLQANGISTPSAAPMALPGAMPRIDNGPAATTPQGPTWNPQAPMANPPLPPHRPQMGPPMPQGYGSLPNGVPPGMALPQGQTFMSAPNSPQLNLPKGPTYMSAAPTNGSSTDIPFWAQYLYGIK